MVLDYPLSVLSDSGTCMHGNAHTGKVCRSRAEHCQAVDGLKPEHILECCTAAGLCHNVAAARCITAYHQVHTPAATAQLLGFSPYDIIQKHVCCNCCGM